MLEMPAGIFDMVWTDPPFNIKYTYDVYEDDREAEDYLAWCESWLSQIHRVLAADGTFWLAIGPRFVSELDVLCKRLGFHKRAQINWYVTFGVACVNNFALSNTYLLYYTKSRKDFHFDRDACRVPSARQLIYNDKRANAKGKLPDDTWILRPQDVPNGFRADETTWHCPRVAGTFKSRHDVPTHFPEQVVARCVRICAAPGDLILDPMAGSGTTPAVCKKLGFGYTAIELSEDYAAKMARRLDGITEGDPLDGPKIQD